MRVSGWIWAGSAVFLVHDAEEILTVAPWLRVHRDELPVALQAVAAGVTTVRFALAVLLLFAGFVAATGHGAWRAGQHARSLPFLVVAGMLVGNAVTHVGQGLLFRGYTPGIITALLLVLPYGYFLGRRLERAGLTTRRVWAWFVVAGAIAQVPLTALVLLGLQ
jgi:hypothetical protein